MTTAETPPLETAAAEPLRAGFDDAEGARDAAARPLALRLETLQEDSGLGLYRWETGGGTIACDDVFRGLWGFPPNAAISAAMLDRLIEPEDRERVHAAFRDPPGGEAPGRFALEYRIRRADDGAMRWLSITARGRIVDGACVEYSGTVGDITLPKQTERALRESEERYRSLLDATAAIVWTADPHGAFVEPQPAWHAYTGQPPAAYAGWGWLDALHEDDRAPFAAAWRQALAAQTAFRGGGRILHAASGRYRWFEARAVPVFAGDGALREWIGAISDIDERRQTAIDLQRTEARLALALEAAELGAWDIDLRLGKGLWSDALFHMLGHRQTPGNIVERELWDRSVYPDDVPLVRDAARKAAADGSLFNPVHRIIRADTGEVLWVQPAGRLLADDHGRPARFIGVLANITERKRVEDHLRMLLDELNHRVKNSLAIIQSMVRQTLVDGVAIEDARQKLESRLLTLAHAHDLLTRQSGGATHIEEIARLTLAPFSATAEETAAPRLAFRGPAVPIPSRAALSLTMALHELATNAAKYGALAVPEGRVSLTWEHAPATVTIDWREEGGPPVAVPERRGFGMRLLERGLARDLNGTVALDFAPEGVHCRISFPVSEPTASRR
jgi:PAS domain S-box-containing protein